MIAKFTHLRFSIPNRIFFNLPLYIIGESTDEINSSYDKIKSNIEKKFIFANPNPPLYLATKVNKEKYDKEIRIETTKHICPVWLHESKSGNYDDSIEFSQTIEITNDIKIVSPNPIKAGVIIMNKDEVVPSQLDFK